MTDLAGFEAEWSHFPWMESLFPIPATATLPRLMTGPHPNAVGSYGPQAITDIEARRAGDPGVPVWEKQLRWWQKLVLIRQFEHDASGALCWFETDVSTGRQTGKSVLLSERSWWRCERYPQLAGRPQSVMHVAKDVDVARKVQRPIRRWAMRVEYERKEAARAGLQPTRQSGPEEGALFDVPQQPAKANSRGVLPRDYAPLYVPRGRTGAEEIEWGSGWSSSTPTAEQSLWMIRSETGAVGYSVDGLEVDEAWDISVSTIEDDLEPTMLARPGAQMTLTSSAHPKATPLFPGRRRLAISDLARPRRRLLIEWSARRDWDPGEERSWRAASPHWDANRRAFIQAKHTDWTEGHEEEDLADAGGFVYQYLNVWPENAGRAEKGTPLLEDGELQAAVQVPVDSPPDVVAVDSWFGDGFAVAQAWRVHDGVQLAVSQVPDGESAAALIDTLGGHPRLLIGKQHIDEQVWSARQVEPIRTAARVAAFGLRTMLRAGQLWHDGGSVLTEQLLAARVADVDGLDGPRLLPASRTEALRAAYAAACVALVPEPVWFSAGGGRP